MEQLYNLNPESVTLQANIPRKSPSALTGAINCRKIGCECLKRAAWSRPETRIWLLF